MCGRFTLRVPLTVLAERFLFDLTEALADVVPRYNIAPTQDVLAVRRDDAGRRELTAFHWGLIPPWAKDARLAYRTINARAESVATSPAFRAAFQKRRCLVPADGYYEWLRVGKEKRPYLYELDGGQPFAFAGLWERWRGPEGTSGPPLESCSLITTTANELQSRLHDRMPVILDPADYDLWLDPGADRAMLQALLVPHPSEGMTATPVSQYVNNSRHEGAECIESLTAE